MAYTDYEKAQKLGKKAYRMAAVGGRSPYLPVLDEILKEARHVSEMSLGLVQIPLDKVIGTSTVGRTYSFANNFMPLLDYKTEFGAKWSALYDSHMEEGIRDPIKVYEYYNNYYVVEGNKRVSVLKYVGAISVPAYVTRKVPERTQDLENKIYYEYMDFFKVTGINIIYFSKEGSFPKMLELTYPGSDKWTDDDKINFTSLYYNFEAAYRTFPKALVSQTERSTTGDALLSYLEFYGYENVMSRTIAEIKEDLGKIRQELKIKSGDSQIDIALNPPAEKKSIPILSSILTQAPTEEAPLNVAFIYDRDPMDSGWYYSHELGRNQIKQEFGGRVNVLRVICDDSGSNAEEIMDELIEKEKVSVIFTTTPELIDASLKEAVKHPEVKVLNCSVNTAHGYIRTYYSRLYEAKFLSGMIAGIMTDTGNLGYISDYPIYGTIANINAFALGARMVRPGVRVHLRWDKLKGVTRESLMRDLRGKDVDVVSDQNLAAPDRPASGYGLYKLTGAGSIDLAMPVYNWGRFYTKLLELIINGSSGSAQNDSKTINYWWGLPSGVIDIFLSGNVPPETARLVEYIKGRIKTEDFNVFRGRLTDGQGNERCSKDSVMTPEDIIKMDWLLDNVEGTIPDSDKFSESAQNILRLEGISKDVDPE